MCALQECSSTPLLFNKMGVSKPANFKSKESLILCSDPSLQGYSEQCYKTALADDEFFLCSADRPLENNITQASDEKPHLQAKNVFQVPRNTYSEVNTNPGEIDHLLYEENFQKSCFTKEAECAFPHASKKYLSQRSASDYSLSKRYDEFKSAMPIKSSDSKQNCESAIHPFSETHPVGMRGVNSDGSILNNCACHMPTDVQEEEETNPPPPSFHKRNSLPMDCEPSSSGLYQNSSEDPKSSDNKNLYIACNLNPTVNTKIFDTESLSESGETSNGSMTEVNYQRRVLDEAWFLAANACHTFNGAELSGSASAAQLSIASSFGDSNTPTCKICHMPAKTDDPLISPCRCTGTLHYIHCGCLMRWLEICNKRSRKPPACELCKYQFHWHKKFKVRHWQFPHCSWRDKILHTVFLISILVMIGCAIVTVMCFKQHRENKPDLTHLELTQSEIITLICGALFFLAFFLAMYVEIKARNTIYKLLVKFIYLNQQWYIDEYDKKGENTVIDV